MSPSATRSSHSGKSPKSGERKTARKAVRAHKPVKPVRPKPKPAARARAGEPKPKRVTKAEKTKKAAKTAEARPARARTSKASRPPQAKRPPSPSRRGRRPVASTEAREMLATVSPATRDAPEADVVEEYIESSLVLEEEGLVVPDDIELDPIGIPLTLLDPELVDVPRPTLPKPKSKITRTERRPQACAGCGQTFVWLSVDGYCFSCLKRKLSQRKREDESFSGFTPEAEDDDEG
jgi:hypothetical protein